MSSAKSFFSEEQSQQIISAIREAEKDTSGEIRVHLEDRAKPNALEQAKLLFVKLGMNQTDLHNGVLIYLAVQDHQFAIVGGPGIDKKVPIDFWDEVRNLMQSHFKNGDFAGGLAAGILMAGEQLRQYFPCATDDKNELTDDISYE
jgi:uncharacterized membrane protein